MSWIDWSILFVPILIIGILLFRTQKYCRTVADFLVGGRTGGRYLLTAADGISSVGLISLVAVGQRFYHSGWTYEWWSLGLLVVGTLLSLSGFVLYRYRETRVMALAQFFEIRYSRKFRIAMGAVCYLSGIINFGIFPAVGANFFICILGLPPELYGIPTYPLLMLLFLGCACLITISGGQVQNMMTDTVQALLLYGMCVVVAVVVICLFSVDDFREALCNRPEGMSYVNPFDTGKLSDFNIYFFLINIFFLFAHRGAWQGNQGYAASAVTPHEAKMGSILGTWRKISLNFFILAFCLGGAAVLFSGNYEGQATDLMKQLNSSFSAVVVDQMQMPMALSVMLPVGIKGVFAAVLFFLMLSTDTTYIHSRGSIFVQDVVLPIYGREISQKNHLRLLRCSVLFVALFGFLFSLLYKQSEYINMFQMLTGVIFSASAGCAIIWGLYWRRATAAGAWAAMGVGTSIGLFFVVLLDSRCWAVFRGWLLMLFPDCEILLQSSDRCPLNGAWLAFIATLLAQAMFIIVSLCTYRRPYNLDRLLHRGRYSDGEKVVVDRKKIPVFKRIFFGFDEEFTWQDKIISVSVACWVFGWGICFLVVTAWNIIGFLFPNPYIRMWPEEWWFGYLITFLGIHLILSPFTAVWLAWGGIRDLLRMYKLLRENQHSCDDGYVSEAENTERQNS